MLLAALLVTISLVAACGGGPPSQRVLRIGGIPDQEAATLSRLFNGVAQYLSRTLGVKVEYVPTVSYSALVTAFAQGDIQLAWFGGLTGVQARVAAPGAMAIAQRPRDAQFHSVFVVQEDLPVHKLADLKGLTFTFGSETSTSGHLMPRYFLLQAAVDPERDFKGKPSFSGSHDKTWKLVESGAFAAGALNEAVWEKALADGKVQLSKIRAFHTTPPYYDYHWAIRGDADNTFGNGFTEKVSSALLGLAPSRPQEREILDLFVTDRFVTTSNENYQGIEEVARGLGIIQ